MRPRINTGLLFTVLAMALPGARCADDAVAPRSGMFQPKPIEISSLTATPNPGTVGQAITISGVIKTSEEKNEVFATLNFGDGNSQSYSGDTLADLKAVQHTYSTAGVFAVTLNASTPFLNATSTLYVVVGRGTVVNSVNGLIVTATDNAGLPREASGAGSRYSGGLAKLGIVVSRAGGTTASTFFDDIPGRSATATGLSVSHTYINKGIFVATVTGQSGTSSVGKVRKMLNISARDAGESAALNDPASADIKIKKLQGKFLFTKSDPDQVSFSGEIALPAGFDPLRPDGNSLSVGIGNVIDTVTVDAKGAATLPGTANRITKVKIKYPKLAGAITAGGEVAKVDVTFNVADLDIAGFDTEGITAALRADELKLKAASRFIQVDLLLGGVAYETLAPVGYKVSKGGEAGQFKGIPSRAAPK